MVAFFNALIGSKQVIPQNSAFSHNPATQILYDQVLDRFAA
jgi:hypothetical protein